MMMMNPPPNFHPQLMPPMLPPDCAPRSGVPLSKEQFYREQQRLLDFEKRYKLFTVLPLIV